MIILKIIGFALLAIVFLIAVILSLNLKVVFAFDTNGRIELYAKILFYKLYDIHVKKESGKIGRYLKRIFGITALTDTEGLKQGAQTSGISDTATKVITVLSLLAGQVVWLLKRIKIKKFHLLAICGGEDAADAAMDYGLVCAAVYPFVGYLESTAKFAKKANDIQVGCDFEGSAYFETEIIAKIRLIHAVRAIWRNAMQNADNILDSPNPLINNGGNQQ